MMENIPYYIMTELKGIPIRAAHGCIPVLTYIESDSRELNIKIIISRGLVVVPKTPFVLSHDIIMRERSVYRDNH